MSEDARAGAGEVGRDPVRRASEFGPQTPGIDLGRPRRQRASLLFLAAAVALSIHTFSYHGFEPSVPGLAEAGGASIGAVANGSWWKLLTANLLHGSLVHLGMNAVVLVVMGRMLEYVVGPAVTAVVIAWSALLSSAGALAIGSAGVTIGASGVAFGLTAAAVAVDPWARTVLGITARQLLVLNVIFTFLAPNVSVGGHLGGLVAGGLIGAICWRDRLPRATASTRRDEDVADDPRLGTPAVAGSARPGPAIALGGVAAVLAVALAIGPPAVGRGAAESVDRVVVAPLLERQLADGVLSGGGDSVDVVGASCEREAVGAFTCLLEVRGDARGRRFDVRFDRTDDQWSARAS